MTAKSTSITTLIGGKLLCLAASHAVQSTNDAAYPFEQESNFFYLTGIREQGWLLIVDGIEKKSWLVAPDISDTHKLFDGELDHTNALISSGVDSIISQSEAEAVLRELAEKYDTVSSLGPHPHEKHFSFRVNPAQDELNQRLATLFTSVHDCRKELSSLRAIKSKTEQMHIRAAVDVTVDTFTALRRQLSSQQYEYQLEAIISHGFRYAGTMGHAYSPIVAGGGNACTLHYTKNDDPLPKNGLVLIDAGARVNGYCADVTRTYAIGTPTDRQKAVHAAVEKAHHAIIALLGPEKSVKEYHEEVDAIMIEALKSLNLYKKPSDYRKYFPHAISHGLGIDVHDPLGNPSHFKSGMVLTVEPGIYIPEEGIGVRIEDDILIADDGIENLSGDLPTSL